MDYLFLVVALTLIVVGAMLLTDGSVALARRMHIPEFIVGLTVVAVGTSMPEMAVSMVSAVEGYGDMAIGNVVGSNIANTLLILGMCAIFSPILFTKSNVRRDVPMNLWVSLVLLLVAFTSASINRIEGVLLLVAYVAMIIYSIRNDRKTMTESKVADVKGVSGLRIGAWVIAGLAGLIYGGDLFVTSATNIAKAWGVSEAVIAISLVAVGTSLPELAASLASIFKGSPSIALGNIIGSNIANILLILGACSTVTPLVMNCVSMTDIYVVVATAVILLLSALFIGDRRITRVEGILFLLVYVAYIYTLI
ncbi:MAG: calcium/sodium antiporter [Alistipes sp.]|nr:calcium/sodium antiporter [Alistipes sp.]